MEDTKLSLFEIQEYCERNGYKCSGKIESGKCRLLLYINGYLEKEAELIDFSEMPKAYAEKYTALYKYLIDSAKSELTT